MIGMGYWEYKNMYLERIKMLILELVNLKILDRKKLLKFRLNKRLKINNKISKLKT